MKTNIFYVISILSFIPEAAPQRDRRLPPVGATIDQLIASSMGGIEGYVNISNRLVTPGSKVLAELDMYLTSEQYRILYSPQRERPKRKAVRSGVLRWPNGEVPYVFKRGAYSNADRYMIRVAMREWEKYSCLRFRKRQNEYNYVIFQDNFGCNSQLGMVGGGQPLNLDRNGCRYKGLYLHEIGHAVGLVHEHQRPIRDQFIQINYRNVQPSLRQWFQKYPNRQINNFNISYEFSSVMHYGTTAFSFDGRSKTIEAQPQYKAQEAEIGRVYSKELSFTDIATVNNMYYCNRHCSRNTRCRNGGFVDQNCRCSCPDGTSDCEVGKVPQFQFCRNKDKDWSCNVWAKQGECERNPRYMKPNCARACGICSDALAADRVVGDQCVDAYPEGTCKGWKAIGDCVSNEKWMAQNCKKTCGVCDKDSDPPGTGCSNIQPDRKCDDWAVKGECGVNPQWMERNCRKSCRLCPEISTTTHRPPPRTTPQFIPTRTTVQPFTTSTIPPTTMTFLPQATSELPPNTTSILPPTTTFLPQTTTTVFLPNTTSGLPPIATNTLPPTTTTTRATVTTTTRREPVTTTRLPITTRRFYETTTLSTRTTTQRAVVPAAPVVSVRIVTSESVDFKVTFPQDGSRPTFLKVKPFQRGLKQRSYPIEFVNNKPRSIVVEYFKLKPKTTYSFRFFAISRAGTGQSIDKTIITKTKDREGSCRNDYSTAKCQTFETKWKFCRLHRTWMMKHCKQTCGLCPVQREEPVRTGDPNCKDTNKYCQTWSRHGHCVRNPSYMLNYCKAACRVCTPAA
ncbi:zinc metalloproteinase nas-15-like [Saccostrea echinata]|uniref:zinc metalloproteinase nas-15-like n=1 Tax=Saccostrea echinata TaxID=191078 RepID=UPI002A814C95|nr:zinc metalloproteinase nas-15-like [Saccostrea echinata]